MCQSDRLLEFIHVRIALIHQAAFVFQTIRANKGACVAAYVRTEEQSLGWFRHSSEAFIRR